MDRPSVDERSSERRTRDDQIAAERKLSPPELPSDAGPAPVESFLARSSRRPLAVEGVVENGLVRPLDPSITLPERARVIIVATQPA
jgi:hypothetical protein